ncbi:MAG: cupredoxin domain-containing protein [Candidatus Limnocylindria bacterium]
MIASATRPTLAVLLGAGLVMALVATATPVRAATEHAVEIVDFAFAPAELTITAGDSVTWTNLDVVAHTATAAGAFDSGNLEQGESYRLTFTTPGTYDYLCTPHPSMTGRIVVVAAPATPAPATPAPAAPAPTTPAPTSGGELPDVAMRQAASVNVPLLAGIALIVLSAVTVIAPALLTRIELYVTHGDTRAAIQDISRLTSREVT